MKANTLTSKGTVTIPIEFRQRFRLNSGDEILFEINKDGELVLRKAPSLQEIRKANRTHLPKRYVPITDASDYFLNEQKSKG